MFESKLSLSKTITDTQKMTERFYFAEPKKSVPDAVISRAPTFDLLLIVFFLHFFG